MSAVVVDALWNTVAYAFETDHKTASGHFPGNPIIPGALLLDHVLRAMDLPATALQFRSVKFLHPIRPGDHVIIRWRSLDQNETAFECRLIDTEEAALSGSLMLGVE